VIASLLRELATETPATPIGEGVSKDKADHFAALVKELTQSAQAASPKEAAFLKKLIASEQKPSSENSALLFLGSRSLASGHQIAQILGREAGAKALTQLANPKDLAKLIEQADQKGLNIKAIRFSVEDEGASTQKGGDDRVPLAPRRGGLIALIASHKAGEKGADQQPQAPQKTPVIKSALESLIATKGAEKSAPQPSTAGMKSETAQDVAPKASGTLPKEPLPTEAPRPAETTKERASTVVPPKAEKETAKAAPSAENHSEQTKQSLLKEALARSAEPARSSKAAATTQQTAQEPKEAKNQTSSDLDAKIKPAAPRAGEAAPKSQPIEGENRAPKSAPEPKTANEAASTEAIKNAPPKSAATERAKPAPAQSTPNDAPSPKVAPQADNTETKAKTPKEQEVAPAKERTAEPAKAARPSMEAKEPKAATPAEDSPAQKKSVTPAQQSPQPAETTPKEPKNATHNPPLDRTQDAESKQPKTATNTPSDPLTNDRSTRETKPAGSRPDRSSEAPATQLNDRAQKEAKAATQNSASSRNDTPPSQAEAPKTEPRSVRNERPSEKITAQQPENRPVKSAPKEPKHETQQFQHDQRLKAALDAIRADRSENLQRSAEGARNESIFRGGEGATLQGRGQTSTPATQTNTPVSNASTPQQAAAPQEGRQNPSSSGGDTPGGRSEGTAALNSELQSRIRMTRNTLSHFSSHLKEAVENYKPPLMRVAITLNPKELGEVEVILKSRGKNLQVSLQSNPQAVALLYQNSGEFRQNLQQLGFLDVGLSFDHEGEGQQQGQPHDQGGHTPHNSDDEAGGDREEVPAGIKVASLPTKAIVELPLYG
jgi:hypothetical protein